MVETFFPAFDFIGVPVVMNQYGREKFRTALGGICSLFFTAFLIWSIYLAAWDLFSTLNPKVVTSQSYIRDPEAISITKESFPIGFALQAPATLNYVPFKNESIFTLQIYHKRQESILNPDGSRRYEVTMTAISIEDCPDDYFGTQETSLSTINLNKVFCIAKEQPLLDKLEVQGVRSSDVYQEIVVTVLACNTNTSSVECASPEMINQYLTGSWFNAIYVNTVLDAQNHTNPNTTFNDRFYTMIDPSYYREVEMHLGYTEINTDNGWITEELTTQEFTTVNKVNDFIQVTEHPQKVLLNCVIKMSQLATSYTRSYKKAQGSLAEVWSAANVVLLIIIVLINPLIKLKFRESLMNELFDVQAQQKDGKKAKKKQKPKLNKSLLEYLRMNSNQRGDTDRDEIRRTIEPSSAKMLTNLNTSYDKKTLERMNTSPLNSARPLISRELELSGRKKSSDNVIGYLNRPKFPILKKSATIGGTNVRDSLWKRRMHSRTNTQIEDIKEEAHIEEREAQAERKLEEDLANINKMKMDLEDGDKRIDLLQTPHGAKKVESKSLHEENSLHLSFSSDGEVKSEGDTERREDRVEHKEIVITLPEKRTESINEDIEEIKEKYNPEKTVEINTAMTSERDKEKEPSKKEISKKLSLSIWEYIHWFTLRPKSLQKKKEFYDDGIKKINERLDMANLMKKLREIDKLRALLLDSDQLVLFNNLPKPEVGPKTQNYLGQGSTLGALLQDANFVEEDATKKQIINSINNLKSKKEKTEIDKKLIEIYEEKLENK